jgi:glycosyltransferase involved in cell wall biosynthesis
VTGVRVVAPEAPADALLAALDAGATAFVGAADDESLATLAAALDNPGVVSASPVPCVHAPDLRKYGLHPALPPAPSLAVPNRRLCAFRSDAVASIVGFEPTGSTAAHAAGELGERLTHHGWRHVAAPGLALDWDPADTSTISPTGGWNATSVASLVGPATAGLEAHRSWADAQLGRPRIVVDGACMNEVPFTGTQHLVLEVTRWLARTRPAADVVLAAPRTALNDLRAALSGERVEVVSRSGAVAGDVLYRPYQMLFADELDFVLSTGRRGLVGQLDMIGFSNPSYHPSEHLLFFARNLQRHVMRSLDGVTFISEFGRHSAVAECPDLDRERLHVAFCGADPTPLAGRLEPGRPLDATTPFLVCLASTFWHKNRAHAIRTFAELVDRHGYKGQLVIAGPQPYYGRSLGEEEAVLGALPATVAARVHRWGHISDDEKWWLLRHADAALYPSVVEGFGLVPFEAAAVGTPCLVASGTAPAELLGGTGAPVADWAPAAWADLLAELISDPGARSALVAEIAAVAERLTWERCAHRTWDAIDHALAAPRRSLHAEDGGQLARVAGSRRRGPRNASLRFLAARGGPAVRRRLLRVISRVRSRGG